MAIPKKRKKLVSSEEKTAKLRKSSAKQVLNNSGGKTKQAPANDTRAGQKMEKAFELIENIDAKKQDAVQNQPSFMPDNPPDTNRQTFRFRIALDAPQPAVSPENPALIDIGINIPARVLKIPIIGPAARRVIGKISKQ